MSLIAVGAVHSPWAPIAIQAGGHAFTNVVGQEHPWSLFAPDPRGISLDIVAVIEFEGGSEDVWKIDRRAPGGGFRSYRWVQWMESVLLSDNTEQVESLVSWLVRDADEPVARVVVYGLRRPPATVGDDRPPASIEVLVDVINHQIINHEGGSS